MLERLTSWFPFVLLAALVGLTFWLDTVVQAPVRAADPATRNDPDYVVDKLSAIRTNQDGIAVYTLSADRMAHYPHNDTTLLTKPRFVSHRSGQAPVTITAREALLSGNGDNVYFRDDVKVTRAPYGGRSEMVLRTVYLHVIPDDNIAKTEHPVTISDAATVVDAVGMELNSETRVLKLLSRIRGTYDPGKAPGKTERR